VACLALFCASSSFATFGAESAVLFTNSVVPTLRIEASPEAMRTLRAYHQVWGQPRPERVDVRVTVRDGDRVFTNVAMHLKGSFTFQPIDDKPSLTLNFDKFSAGQRYRGYDKIHLNNSVQDPSYLCEALASEVFNQAGVPAPRVGHARVTLNGRELGPYVAIEGSNKRFLKRHFNSVKGNLYDGGSGGDITKKLKADSGEHPEDRSDLERLVAATRVREAGERFAQLERTLDLDRFLTFAALEVLFQHWDGYCMGPNNFRVFHDLDHDRMVFMPHGMDQALGVGRSPATSIQPHWNGVVAKGLFGTGEGRRRYLERLGTLFTNQFRPNALVARVDQMAGQLRPQLTPGFIEGFRFRAAVDDLKERIRRRAVQVQEQLDHPEQPLSFGAEGIVSLSGWRFRAATARRAEGRRVREEGRDLLEVKVGEANSSGSWRTIVLLDPGHYEFTGLGRALGVAPGATNSGVLLRTSGDRTPPKPSVAAEWSPLRYEFEVQGRMNLELICEFRGSEGSGTFDGGTLKLRRRPTSGR